MDKDRKIRQHVERWKTSGLSKVAYASKAGIRYHQFAYWVKKLRKADSKSQFLPLVLADSKTEKVELTIGNAEIKMGIETFERLLPIILKEGKEC